MSGVLDSSVSARLLIAGSRPPFLQKFKCQLDSKNGLYAEPSEGHCLVLLGDRLTFMMYREHDSIPFFVDVPMAAIEDVHEQRERSPKGANDESDLTIGLVSTLKHTLYIDGAGYKPSDIKIRDDSVRGQLARLIKTHQRKAKRHAGSQALSPANVSAPRSAGTMLMRLVIQLLKVLYRIDKSLVPSRNRHLWREHLKRRHRSLCSSPNARRKCLQKVKSQKMTLALSMMLSRHRPNEGKHRPKSLNLGGKVSYQGFRLSQSAAL